MAGPVGDEGAAREFAELVGLEGGEAIGLSGGSVEGGAVDDFVVFDRDVVGHFNEFEDADSVGLAQIEVVGLFEVEAGAAGEAGGQGPHTDADVGEEGGIFEGLGLVAEVACHPAD